jgi:hypothetical protein
MSEMSDIEVFGDFIELDEDRAGESLTLRFSPSSTPLQQRWRNNGLSADFLAGYVSTFLPVDSSDPASARRQADTAAAVGYVANELLENAMKYSAEGSGKSISMRLHLESRRIIFHQSNSAAPDRAAALRDFIAKLETLGASEMLLKQMENGGDENGSGLGLLTMVNDYGARLAFQVAACKEDDETVITTQVELDA